jgi:outer membrane protein TolC
MTTQAPFRLLAATITLFITACSSPGPKSLSIADMKVLHSENQINASSNVEPITGALSLDAAMARALKYNSSRRVKLLEEALANNQLDVSKLDMLPKLVASAGLAHRSIERATYSSTYPGMVKGTSASFSSDPNHSSAELGLTWNLLDVGLGYYGAQQSADRLLISVEQRRKAMHQLMQDVRVAYWRSAAAQLLQDRVQQTIATGEAALVDAKKVEVAGQSNPIDALRYQRQLLENLRLLETINQELSSANIELASLINAPLGQHIMLAEIDSASDSNEVLSMPVERLETAALQNNPDLLESAYNARIARAELRKTMTRLFPSVSFNYSVKYDTDKFMVDRNWNEAGLQISFNLFNIMTGPTQVKLAKAGIALADQRRVATQMAVLSQMHISRLALINAESNFSRADAIYKTDLRISELVNNRAKVRAQSQLDKVSNDTAAIVSLLRRYQAMSQVQAAQARLRANLGLEPKIGNTQALSLAELTQQLDQANTPWSELKQPSGW